MSVRELRKILIAVDVEIRGMWNTKIWEGRLEESAEEEIEKMEVVGIDPIDRFKVKIIVK